LYGFESLKEAVHPIFVSKEELWIQRCVQGELWIHPSCSVPFILGSEAQSKSPDLQPEAKRPSSPHVRARAVAASDVPRRSHQRSSEAKQREDNCRTKAQDADRPAGRSARAIGRRPPHHLFNRRAAAASVCGGECSPARSPRCTCRPFPPPPGRGAIPRCYQRLYLLSSDDSCSSNFGR
jgi:hypothetical protein